MVGAAWYVYTHTSLTVMTIMFFVGLAIGAFLYWYARTKLFENRAEAAQVTIGTTLLFSLAGYFWPIGIPYLYGVYLHICRQTRLAGEDLIMDKLAGKR